MRTYKNPFIFENQWSENECGDPFIMRFNGYYYLYCSSAGNHVKAWRSENLVDFSYLGSVCDEPVIDGAYAPEVCYCQGKFYMVTSPVGSGHYLLEGDKPEGPFKLISKNYGLMIDGSFFIDDDGSQYLLRAGHKGIVIHRMPERDAVDVNGVTIPESYLNYWTEGPMIIKRKGYYYLTYTGNHLLSKGYRVAYSISAEGPDRGYVNLKDNLLLLETGDEFHALGHSSSFLAPDLDGYCIAYHNIELDVKPRRRSTNIDRLFFNGARMYCNPIWWEQEAPSMPDYYGWGEEVYQSITIDSKEYWAAGIKALNTYTAEISVNTKDGDIALLYGYGDSLHGQIKLKCNSTYEINEDSKRIREGQINSAVSFQGLITVRLAKTAESKMEIYINNIFLTSYQTGTSGGTICLKKDRNQEPGFLGISHAVNGNSDKLVAKAIPGRMDAVHSIEEIESCMLTEAGFQTAAAVFRKNKKASYQVNIKEDGCYQLSARISSEKRELCLMVTGEERDMVLDFNLMGIKDSNGFEKVKAGKLELVKGIKIIEIISSEDLLVDYFIFEKAAEVRDIQVVNDGTLVTNEIKIYGHKQFKSMLTKYSGFTCAENFGRAFVGENGWENYIVNAAIYRNNTSTGEVSIYARASRESWFPDQTAASLVGYRIMINCEGICLYRCSYGEEQIGFYSHPCNVSGILRLSVMVKGAVLKLLLEGETVFTYADAEGFLNGKVGLEATGEGFAFEEFAVYSDLSL